MMLVMSVGLCGCTVTRSKSADGSALTTASVLENAESKTVTFDPATGFVTIDVSKQDQVSGAKAIGATLATLETIDAGAEYLMKRLGKEQAVETATIEGANRLETLKETNRSAEAMQAAAIAAQE